MKTGILITARLKSTRLPRKALKLLAGKPMLAQLVDRLKQSEEADEVSIITSSLEDDSALEQLAKNEGIRCFRGHPDDVLVRMRDAAQAYGLDYVISCTADNPFVDHMEADRLVRHLRNQGLDFACMNGMPFGTFSYALKTSAICKACEIKEEMDTEVWGGYFTETGLFRCGELDVEDDNIRWPDLRLTVDTPEDFDVVARIFESLGSENVFSLKEIVTFCREHPELVAINRQVVQKPGKSISYKKGTSNES